MNEVGLTFKKKKTYIFLNHIFLKYVMVSHYIYIYI